MNGLNLSILTFSLYTPGPIHTLLLQEQGLESLELWQELGEELCEDLWKDFFVGDFAGALASSSAWGEIKNGRVRRFISKETNHHFLLLTYSIKILVFRFSYAYTLLQV